MKYLFTFLLLVNYTNSFANDSLLITQLLERIAFLQTKEDGIFPKGSFPSYRMYALNKDRFKADINPFYTGLISFTLQTLMPQFSERQQQIARNIVNHANPTFELFRNKKRSLPTYNFWPTDRPQIFPNSGWINLLDKSKSLPDDLDDTVILLMALNASDSIANEIHQLMQGYTNSGSKPIRNTYEEFKEINAYSTWFGKKMPIDFDISVMANILYFVQHYNLRWTSADSATLKIIVESVKSNKHVKGPEFISPQYAKSSIIFYHISRLMSKKKIQELEDLKSILIEQTLQNLKTNESFLERILLSTSLLRWGVAPPAIVIKPESDWTSTIEDEETFSYFIASMGSIYPNKLRKFFIDSKIALFYYHCPAFNNMLVLENLIWQKRFFQNQ